MSISLELSAGLQAAADRADLAATHIFRLISRKYDSAEHAYPEELEDFARLSREAAQRGLQGKEDGSKKPSSGGTDGRNMFTVVSVERLCWGDVGLMLARPGSGLGNAAIGAAGTEEQRERFRNCYASMAITEPQAGSDSKNIATTARLDGDEWVINGEKIFVTDGQRSDTVVVWASLDRSAGKTAIRSFVVPKTAPGVEVVRLEHKLGIRASDTATIRFDNCRIPRDHLLGGREKVEVGGSGKAFGAAMQTFDNTRPIVAAMAVGCAQAALDLTHELLDKAGWKEADSEVTRFNRDALGAELLTMAGEIEAIRLLTRKAAWMADNRQPNSVLASMAKAKAGRVCNKVTLRCVELCGSVGYSEAELLEKFARDSKILDIFEGTQQIQQLIIARHLLKKSSSELR